MDKAEIQAALIRMQRYEHRFVPNHDLKIGLTDIGLTGFKIRCV